MSGDMRSAGSISTTRLSSSRSSPLASASAVAPPQEWPISTVPDRSSARSAAATSAAMFCDAVVAGLVALAVARQVEGVDVVALRHQRGRGAPPCPRAAGDAVQQHERLALRAPLQVGEPRAVGLNIGPLWGQPGGAVG